MLRHLKVRFASSEGLISPPAEQNSHLNSAPVVALNGKRYSETSLGCVDRGGRQGEVAWTSPLMPPSFITAASGTEEDPSL